MGRPGGVEDEPSVSTGASTSAAGCRVRAAPRGCGGSGESSLRTHRALAKQAERYKRPLRRAMDMGTLSCTGDVCLCVDAITSVRSVPLL